MALPPTSRLLRARVIPYDPNDATAVDAFWDTAVIRRRGERGQQKAATKEQVSLRLSPEVVSYFKAGGQGWQTRLDQALKEYVKQNSPISP
jgi:uncharacterized protein (DUF4415 family)